MMFHLLIKNMLGVKMDLSKVVMSFVFLGLFVNAVYAESEIVARVNGKPITAFELNEEFQDILPMMGAYHGGVPSEKVAEIREKALSRLIEKELQYQYALGKKLSVPAKDIDAELASMEKRTGSPAKFKDALKKIGITKEELKEVVKKRLLSVVARDEAVTSKVALTDLEVKDYYEKNKETFKRPVEFRASHILIGVEPAATSEDREKKLRFAKDLLAKVRAGEDFAKLASRYSTDEGSAPVGGNIGSFHKGMAEEAFEKAVLSLKVGEVSDIVETLYGYHIIKLTDVKPETQLGFDDVKKDIKGKLEKKRADDLKTKWMDELRAGAKIEIIRK